MQFATIFTLALAAATASAAPTRTADAAAPAVAAAAPSSSAASDIVHPRNWNRPRDVSDNYTPVYCVVGCLSMSDNLYIDFDKCKQICGTS